MILLILREIEQNKCRRPIVLRKVSLPSLILRNFILIKSGDLKSKAFTSRSSMLSSNK